MPFDKEMLELEKRKARTLKMGGTGKIKKQHGRGKLTARERIDKLLDPESFLEVGMFNHSDVPGMEEKTPADSKVAGYGKIDGRQVVVVSNDFTVLAATSSRIVDRNSLFPLKPAFGKSVITALARIDGKVIGIVANQPMFNAGAMDTDGIDKVISFYASVIPYY